MAWPGFGAPSLEAVGQTFLRGATTPNPRVPQTLVRTSHAFVLRVEGTVVGAAFGWVEQHAVSVEDEAEISAMARGFPDHQTVQYYTGREVTLDRYELFDVPFDRAFGTQNITDLMAQRPFSMLTVVDGPAALSLLGSNNSQAVELTGCVFVSRGTQVRADGDRVVSTNAVVRWTRPRRVA